MKVSKYYMRAVVFPSLFVLLFCIVYSLLYSYGGVESAGFALVIANMIPTLIYAILMCVFALPIFLNKIEKLSKSLIFNLLTWFPLPGLYMVLIFAHDTRTRTRFDFGFGDGFIYLIFMVLPYLAGLVLTFVQYRKNLSPATAPQPTEDEPHAEDVQIPRRRFLTLSLAGAATASAGAFIVNSLSLFDAKMVVETLQPKLPFETKKIFHRCGTCSNTLFTALNRVFGHPKVVEELATDPLAGGLMNTGNQCGMLWGSTLALGAESWRSYDDPNMSLAMAMEGARDLIQSFKHRTSTAKCMEITGMNWEKPAEVLKFALPSIPSGFTNMLCVNLGDRWAPEAAGTVKERLSNPIDNLAFTPIGCASEVARRLGGSEEEVVMVAGMAGGIGFSGNACGALGAAIWMNTLSWCRENPGQSGYLNPESQEIMQAFLDSTESEIICSKLCERQFVSVEDHTEFINNGGCSHLIDLLANKA